MKYFLSSMSRNIKFEKLIKDTFRQVLTHLFIAIKNL